MTQALESAEPLAVISPHLDDGVLSCGELLSRHQGSTVITVFAGAPAAYDALTPWDAASGFAAGDDVVAARRHEDEAALALLGARPVWLDFLDAQYAESPHPDAIAPALRDAIEATGAGIVVAPLGLFHSDHLLAAEAALLVARGVRRLSWFVYEDAVYRPKQDLTTQRLQALSRDGWLLSPLPLFREAGQAKRAAVQAYPTQLKALGAPGGHGYADAFEPERYFHLERASP